MSFYTNYIEIKEFFDFKASLILSGLVYNIYLLLNFISRGKKSYLSISYFYLIPLLDISF